MFSHGLRALFSNYAVHNYNSYLLLTTSNISVRIENRGKLKKIVRVLPGNQIVFFFQITKRLN